MAKTFKGYTPIEAPSFDLESPDGERKLHVTCTPTIPGSKFLDFMSSVDGEDPSKLAGAVTDILKAAIPAHEWDEFIGWIDDPNNGIGLTQLSEICGYLAEQYSGRPTQPSPVSLAR